MKNTDRSIPMFVGIAVLCAVAIKCQMIRYGLPYQIHVDESIILKDPFKIALMYMQGNFSQSTNLYNWLIMGSFAIIFCFGLITGRWSGFEQFKTFLIADSPDLLLYGRTLSMVLSAAACGILVYLVLKATKNFWLRVLFIAMIVFNPVEMNSVNWVKFDALAYLAYAVILLLSYDYFFLGDVAKRKVLYVALIISLSVRIELISYLAGFLFWDLVLHRSQLNSFLRSAVKPIGIGLAVYFLVTLSPLTYVYNSFAQPATGNLVTSPTFESAISSKLNVGSILYGLSESRFYVVAILALLGPVLPVIFLLNIRDRRAWYLYPPFLIMAFFLLIFPVKGTHYLLNISVLVIFGSLLFCEFNTSKKAAVMLSLVSVIWLASFAVDQLYLILRGDARIQARNYLMSVTNPSDTLYVDGVFSQIPDKPQRYRLKAEASRMIGSTGLSNDYFASTLSDDATRAIITVSSYEPFANTLYNRIFNNFFDTAQMRKEHPSRYVFVGPRYCIERFEEGEQYGSEARFYRSVEQLYEKDTVFSYPSFDPRLRYATTYYFRPVVIYKPKLLKTG
jgi:hypothetical protein